MQQLIAPLRCLTVVLMMAWLAVAGVRADDVLPDVLPQAPEAASGFQARTLVRASTAMVVAANPLASSAGMEILRDGGSAVDAAIAMQLVLNLVEPQSSGLGGGGFAISFDAARGRVRAWDGRETAPEAAHAGRFLREGRPLSFEDAMNSGLSVGVPGLLRMLALLHREQGRLEWSRLFEPAIRLSREGFAVSPRLHALLARDKGLRAQPAAAAYFYDGDGRAWPVGHQLRNPALAQVLSRIAEEGPRAFYEGRLAQGMVDAVSGHDVPGDLSLKDLAHYRALERPALCMRYRVYQLCGVPPPSSGPLAVMQMLGMLVHTPLAGLAPNSLESVHWFTEAGALAFADRDAWVADPDFVSVPVQGMLDAGYLARRAASIRAGRSLGKALPGAPAGRRTASGRDDTPEQPSTTHLVAADARGNAISMTTSIEAAFGSKILVEGFLLNNQLTDFSLSDTDEDGRALANRVEAGKRPRSSMAPMLVLENGQPVMAIGSPGGSAIISFVAKALVGVLDWGLDIQQAIALPNRGNRNYGVELEAGTSLARLAEPLRAMGHVVHVNETASGLHGIVWTADGLEGGVDPRREGQALGY
ncbi:MAG: gamma-glutamyltransferase [Castellaniella sp.]